MAATERTSITDQCMVTAVDTGSRLELITARALAGNRIVATLPGRATWSDAAKNRLYSRMFPGDPVADAGVLVGS